MENIRNWAAMLSLTAVICTLFEIFVPPGKVSKSMHMVISLFAVCLAVFPLISAFRNFKFEFNNLISNAKPKLSTKFADGVETQASDLISGNIKVVVQSLLREIGLTSKKIEIFMDKNSEGCIVMIRCKIYIEKEFENFKPQIQKEIKNRLNISADVIEV